MNPAVSPSIGRSSRGAPRPRWGARDLSYYEDLVQIGEGTYSSVFLAREKATGEAVALKQIKMNKETEGVSCPSLVYCTHLIVLVSHHVSA